MGLSEETLAALLDDGWRQLQPHERIMLAGDVRAEIERGGLGIGAAMDLVARLLKDGTRHAVDVAVEIANDALAVASDSARPAVVAWIQDTFAPRARKLGFLPDEDDDLDRELVRIALLPLVTEIGRADKLLDRAVELARKWRDLPDGARTIVLRAAVLHSDKVRDQVLAALPAATAAGEIGDLIDALAALDDPEQASAALALLLDPALDLKHGRHLLTGLAEHPTTQPIAEKFLRDHADELLPRMPSEAAAGLVTVLTAACDAGKRAATAAWAKDHLEPLPGGVRTVAQALESMDQCIARKAALGPELDSWLAARD
jgi:cytosol alanyl aminopeptidase